MGGPRSTVAVDMSSQPSRNLALFQALGFDRLLQLFSTCMSMLELNPGLISNPVNPLFRMLAARPGGSGASSRAAPEGGPVGRHRRRRRDSRCSPHNTMLLRLPFSTGAVGSGDKATLRLQSCAKLCVPAGAPRPGLSIRPLLMQQILQLMY